MTPDIIIETGKKPIAKADIANIHLLLFIKSNSIPWASIMLFEINNPKPVPLNDFEVNFVNNRGIISVLKWRYKKRTNRYSKTNSD